MTSSAYRLLATLYALFTKFDGKQIYIETEVPTSILSFLRPCPSFCENNENKSCSFIAKTKATRKQF